jgi:uncharacterized membrane protein YqiK
VKPAQAERDARIAQAEAQARETELAAQANAQRVKIEAEANAQRVKLDAQAQAEATERRGRAEASATQARGEAEAAAARAKGLAEAEAIEARAKALERNQEAVIGQQVAERLPEIVGAAAESFKGIDHMVVLNGAEGMNGMLTQVMGAGVGAVSLFRDLLGSRGSGGNGQGNGAPRGAVDPARAEGGPHPAREG